MKQTLTNLTQGKRVLLLGYGMEGKATHRLLAQTGAYEQLGIADQRPLPAIPDATLHIGEDYLDCIDEYDIAFKSPGIVLPKDWRGYKCEITSQTEAFLQAYGKQVIGITGTKGKSTVSSLLHHVLSASNVPSIFAGNIGKSIFDIVDDIEEETTVIFELSCHQLEICKHSPATAVLLNLYEDHLDHYGTFENYVKAKKNIYLHQSADDILYCTEAVAPPAEEAAGRIIMVSRGILPFDTFEAIGVTKLHGKHNLDNCAFAYSIARTYGVTDGQFIASLRTYAPLPHRLERIGSKDGVDYYDDSISTTAESAISAVESIPNASTILLGGMDRGIEYAHLIEYLAESKLANVICMYESGKRIYDMLSPRAKTGLAVTYCNDLAEAVKTAQEVTPSGGACILSPASASYGDFKNFEERGDVFREMVFLL